MSLIINQIKPTLYLQTKFNHSVTARSWHTILTLYNLKTKNAPAEYDLTTRPTRLVTISKS